MYDISPKKIMLFLSYKKEKYDSLNYRHSLEGIIFFIVKYNIIFYKSISYMYYFY